MSELQETMIECERCGKPVVGRDVRIIRDRPYYDGNFVHIGEKIHVCPECAEKE